MSNLWPVRRDERVSPHPCRLPLPCVTTLTTLSFLRFMISNFCDPLDSYNWSTPSWWPSSAAALQSLATCFWLLYGRIFWFLSSWRPSQPLTRSQVVVACFVLVFITAFQRSRRPTRLSCHGSWWWSSRYRALRGRSAETCDVLRAAAQRFFSHF